MKRIVILALAALSGVTQAVAESLADHEDHKIPEVEYYPDWFINPSDDEYVGVSLPLKNTGLAVRQAVYPALLSYCFQNDSAVKTAYIFRNKSNAAGYITESRTEMNRECRLKYVVTKTAKNKYGEIFVAVKILSGKSGSVIKWRINSCTSMIDENFELQSEIMFQTQTDKLYLKRICRENHSSDSFFCENKGVVEDKTAKESEYLGDNKNYTYRETVFQNMSEPNEQGEIEIPFNSISQPLDYSLGFAYLMGLAEMSRICSNTGNNIRIEGKTITKKGFLEILIPRSD
jgi:hypothetical protein